MPRPVRLTSSTTVGAPADVVYAVIADGSQRPRWMTELKSVDAPARLLERGDHFNGTAQLLGHDFLGASEVTAAEAGHVLEERVVIGARFTSRWTLAVGSDGHTRVEHCIDIEFPRGVLGYVARLVMRIRLAAMQRKSLTRLREFAG